MAINPITLFYCVRNRDIHEPPRFVAMRLSGGTPDRISKLAEVTDARPIQARQ